MNWYNLTHPYAWTSTQMLCGKPKNSKTHTQKNQQWNGQSVTRLMRKMGNTDFKFRISAIKNNGVFAGSSNQNWEK